MDLTGKAAIVTGSASGIGEAVARRLAAAGAGVVINSVRSNETGERIASELPDAVYVQGDIGDPTTAGRLVGCRPRPVGPARRSRQQRGDDGADTAGRPRGLDRSRNGRRCCGST